MAHFRVGDKLYDMDPTTWPNADVSSLQRQLGCGLSKFMERLEDSDVDAIQAMIWVLRRRDDPGLKLEDVTFTFREYIASIEQTDRDVQDVYPTLDFEVRKTFKAQLPQEQQDRLFLEDGRLKPIGAAAPLASAGTTDSETPMTSVANTG